MEPTLVVLAAGMGSRYGGLKQLDPIGPSGETLLDYGVFDALRAGFGRVVFVIRRDFDALFREQVGARYANRVSVGYVHQSLDALPAGFAAPAGRLKPWGTGHAVWCAREQVGSNFAVINADDFYGAESFRRLGEFLRQQAAPAERPAQFAMVGFRLANTLSEHGAVSRGICEVRKNGELDSITERSQIVTNDVGPGRPLAADQLVSMNCWGFTPAVFEGLDEQLRAFLATRAGEAAAEFYLPAAVSTMIARGQTRVHVLPTESTWFGVTYRDDRPRVAAAIAELVGRGQYPAKLFA